MCAVPRATVSRCAWCAGRPSLNASVEAAEDPLTPATFAPVVRRCARARQAAVSAPLALPGLAPAHSTSVCVCQTDAHLVNPKEKYCKPLLAFDRQNPETIPANALKSPQRLATGLATGHS